MRRFCTNLFQWCFSFMHFLLKSLTINITRVFHCQPIVNMCLLFCDSNEGTPNSPQMNCRRSSIGFFHFWRLLFFAQEVEKIGVWMQKHHMADVIWFQGIITLSVKAIWTNIWNNPWNKSCIATKESILSTQISNSCLFDFKRVVNVYLF